MSGRRGVSIGISGSSPWGGGVAHRVVGGGEDDASDALRVRGLVQVVGALDVRLEDLLEGGFQGDARQVDDRVDTSHGLAYSFLVGEVGDDRVRLALDGAQIEQAQVVAVGREQIPHQGAEPAGGTGEQNGTGSGHPQVSLNGLMGTVFTCVDKLGIVSSLRQGWRDVSS